MGSNGAMAMCLQRHGQASPAVFHFPFRPLLLHGIDSDMSVSDLLYK